MPPLQGDSTPRTFSRLARMGRETQMMFVIALAATALGLASCGGEDAKLLPGDTAREISANLEKVGELSAEGDCVGAEAAAQQVGEQIDAVTGVDPKLKQALIDGAVKLNEVVDKCEEEVAEESEGETQPAPSEKEVEEEEKEREALEKESEKEDEQAEKEAEKEEKEAEKEDGNTELPPQANGEGKGLEKEAGPPAEEGESGEPSGGVSPSNPVGEGG
jgi:hypothetical protein